MGAARVTHRVTTQTHVRALLASDVPDNSGSEGLFGMYERLVANLPWWLAPPEKFHQKNQHIVFETGSAILVESGKSLKGGPQVLGPPSRPLLPPLARWPPPMYFPGPPPLAGPTSQPLSLLFCVAVRRGAQPAVT